MNLGALVAALLLSASANATNRYLVQLKSPAAFQTASHAVKMARFSGQADRQARLLNTSAVVTDVLSNVQLFVVESSSPLAIQALRTHPEVAMVEAEVFHPAPKPVGLSVPQAGAQPQSIHAAAQRETPWGIHAVKAEAAWSTTRGNGARVLVLDTGVDTDHPALISRLEAVRNFVSGEDQNDVTDKVGHGSHVAGTILADGLNNAVVGVAPEAKLLMGKVCTELGCSSVSIATGLDWAVTKNVDVVNMSLGGAFMTSMEAAALRNAEARGVMVVAASGNDGQPRVSFPAAADTAFAVGAIDIGLLKADFSNWGPELDIVGPGVDVISSVPRGTGREALVQMDLGGKGLNDVKSLPFVGSALASVSINDVVFCGLGKAEDFQGVTVTGKFALISRGEITFEEKIKAAKAAGAVGVVIYNNVPGLFQGAASADGSTQTVPVVMIEQMNGEAAKASLAAGEAVSFQLEVSPSDYASLQGTSMATPHVAGVAALVRAANKSLTPLQVRALLKATATPMGPNDQNQFGAGLVNAEAAVAAAKGSPRLFQAAN